MATVQDSQDIPMLNSCFGQVWCLWLCFLGLYLFNHAHKIICKSYPKDTIKKEQNRKVPKYVFFKLGATFALCSLGLPQISKLDFAKINFWASEFPDRGRLHWVTFWRLIRIAVTCWGFLDPTWLVCTPKLHLANRWNGKLEIHSLQIWRFLSWNLLKYTEQILSFSWI